MRYVLDSDHISLLQRGHSQVLARVATVPPDEIAVAVVTVEEQLQGRLAVIRRARSQSDAAYACDRLIETVRFYSDTLVLRFDPTAVTRFEELRRQGIRIGTQDLRIAAIALTHQMTLVTRNRRDFGRIPGLPIEDWSEG